MKVSPFHLGLGLLAGALLAYELLLLRLFKLAHGAEFPTIAISLALLGFGASVDTVECPKVISLSHTVR